MRKIYPVLGDFGKGIKGSKQLSFGTSGGKHCLVSCEHHPSNSGACYAAKNEKFRKNSTGAKTARHELMHPTLIVNYAISELVNKILPTWFRFSVFSSMPKKVIAKSKGFKEAILRLVSMLDPRTTHIPVETNSKAEFYRELFPKEFVIRESLQSIDALETYEKQASIVVGSWEQSPSERAELAYAIASHQRTLGKRAVPCPAIVSNSKCGQCKACASHSVDLVIYPLHK